MRNLLPTPGNDTLALANAGPRVCRICSLIDSQLRERLSPAALAKYVHLSESRLTHLFKQNTGSSLMAYIKQQRLRRAAQLLVTTDLCIKQIAAEVGLLDMSHFTKDFNRQFGNTPKKFRTFNGYTLETGADEETSHAK